ncbi:MAG: DUF3048 domain-containing protein [Actinomycetota bacterium]
MGIKKFLRKSILALFLLFLIIAVLSCGRKGDWRKRIKSIPEAKEKPSQVCPICGMEVASSEVSHRPIAVIVENLVSIRPQSGLDKACVVFEALAEGGITRLLAIYFHQDANVIGPVRSARPYHVALVPGFDAIFAHCGGSPRAMNAIKTSGIADLDQFAFPQAYWRVRGIKAPHNLFTSTKGIRNVARKVGLEKGVLYRGFKHKPDAPLKKRPEGQKITINFSSPAYKVQYSYDRKSNSYLRFNGGEPHMERTTGSQLQPKNVVVMYCPTEMYDIQRLNIQVVGKGKCLVFRDGIVVEGIWHKAGERSELSFKDEHGSEIPFNPGQIWVEIVKPGTGVKY